MMSRLAVMAMLPALVQGHGYISKPASRAAGCYRNRRNTFNQNCGAVQWEPWSVEGLKRYPAGGPRDGEIAGAGVGMWSPLNAYGTGRWGKVDMSSGVQDFVWTFQTPHSSRDFRYWVTKRGWNPDAPLTRAQFEAEPFCKVEYFGRLPGKKETHSCNVPRRSGYHVILSTWDVADTPNAFYAVVDANFGGVDIPLPPTPPTPPVTPAPTPQPTPWPAPPVVDGCRDLTGAGGKPWYPLKWGLEWTCSKYFAADPERTETRCADYSAAVWANAETGTHAGQACCVCGGGEAVGPQPSTQPPATPKPTQEPVPEPTPEPTQEPTTCEASTRAGYDCMQAITVGTVFWRLARDGASVDLALEVAGSGYAALGFGDGMVGADVAIAQRTVGRFDIASRSRAGITASDKTVSDASVTRADGTTFLAFSWPVESNFAVMVAAYHSSSTSLRYHGGRGRAVFGVDFAAVPKATAVPPTPKPTTAVPPTPKPTTAVPPTPKPTTAVPPTPKPTASPPPATPKPTDAPVLGENVWWPAYASRACRPGTAERGAELNKPMYNTRAECCIAHKNRLPDFDYCMTRDWGVSTPATPKPTSAPTPVPPTPKPTTAVPPTPAPTTAVPPTPAPTTAVPPTPKPTQTTVPPTDAPATDGDVFWPAWASSACKGGPTAPSGKPVHKSKEACCKEHFDWRFNRCMAWAR